MEITRMYLWTAGRLVLMGRCGSAGRFDPEAGGSSPGYLKKDVCCEHLTVFAVATSADGRGQKKDNDFISLLHR